MELNIPESAVCLDCGYALRGLHDAICPECGRAFDPANARTFRWRPSVIKRWRELAEPPAGWHIYGVIVVTLLTLYQTSEPPGPRYLLELIPIGCIAVCFGPIFGLAISIDYVVRIIAIKSKSRLMTTRRGSRRNLMSYAGWDIRAIS